ncbi:DUF6478 family protein [Marivita sp. GX14005]|uniref:DUF6478 family protein n=1 Tax=Marivita sp. GX14005 TaxID=2942276 RepID=UPI002019D1B5|nr:DUF6478 family protein [Marivita sp. GX14005]MCL3881334.1 DUF6478 family protein [Marivita sp. GX14005]
MSDMKPGLFDRVMQQSALRRFRRWAQTARTDDLRSLRRNRTAARRMKYHLDELLHVAESRLALPVIGNQATPVPFDADWSWRPEAWCGPLPEHGIASVPSKSMLGREVTLFHDCQQSELTLRQLRNTSAEDLAAYGLRLDVFSFDGSYLSLVIDLPPEAAHGLKRKHLIRLDAIVDLERPLEIFGRLNVQHGPNTEQIVRELPPSDRNLVIEFDLAYTKLNEKRVEKVWIDLIFENPEMSQVVLRDLYFSRRPRAEL